MKILQFFQSLNILFNSHFLVLEILLNDIA